MTISRRQFIAGSAAAGALAVTAAGAGAAEARPVPIGAEKNSIIDRIAQAKYKALVPEVFAPPAQAPTHTPAIVIGTGFGGAVAALRLGQAGVRTTMLERGLPWPRDPWRSTFSPEFPADGRALWHRTTFTGFSGIPVYTDSFGGVMDVTEYEHIQVWRAAAVGGGSVVFTGVLIQPERRFFEAVFQDRLSFDEMDRIYYPRARAMFKASPMPRDIYESKPFGHSRAWDEQARKAGYSPQPIDGIWDWSVIRKELAYGTRKSAVIGESNFGNPNAAKYDLTQNYLPQALATKNVTIHHGHVVESIDRDNRGRYRLQVRVIDPTGATIRTEVLTCDRLFLGAGSIGTSELLVRAKATGALPDLDKSIGAGWGTNGDASLARPFSFSEGITQASPSASRILDESGALPVTLENWYVPGIPLNIGILGSLGMVMDPQRANFRYDPRTDDVVVDWPADGNAATIAALRAVHNKIAKANRVPVGVPPFAPDVNAGFTAHPLGGAVLGDSTDLFGRVKGYEGLYVIDAAAIPGSTGTVNPVLTIVALAERSMSDIIAKGK